MGQANEYEAPTGDVEGFTEYPILFHRRGVYRNGGVEGSLQIGGVGGGHHQFAAGDI